MTSTAARKRAIIRLLMHHTVTLELTEEEYYELKSALEMNRRLAEHFDLAPRN
jgi:hypothetical protein